MRKNSFGTASSVIASGLGIGWLVGLSVSPMVQGVVTAVLTLVVTVTAILAGVPSGASEDKNATNIDGIRKLARNVNPAPLGFLVLAIAVGASLGVYARTHAWLGATWTTTAPWQDPALYSVSISATDWKELHDTPNEFLENKMAGLTNQRIARFAQRCTGHTTCLRAAVEELLCPPQKLQSAP